MFQTVQDVEVNISQGADYFKTNAAHFRLPGLLSRLSLLSHNLYFFGIKSHLE